MLQLESQKHDFKHIETQHELAQIEISELK